VRIGKPDVQLAGNDLKEVNHPMYSTSVGLLLKGFENAIPEPVAEPVAREELIPEFADEKEDTKEPKEPKAPKKMGGFIESIKNTFDGFFDDGTDRKM
jgi:cell division ATPase FtsA